MMTAESIIAVMRAGNADTYTARRRLTSQPSHLLVGIAAQDVGDKR
jgi:hypothetical protein